MTISERLKALVPSCLISTSFEQFIFNDSAAALRYATYPTYQGFNVNAIQSSTRSCIERSRKGADQKSSWYDSATKIQDLDQPTLPLPSTPEKLPVRRNSTNSSAIIALLPLQYRMHRRSAAPFFPVLARHYMSS